MSEEPWAYAKLSWKYNGREIAKFVTTLPTKIGRAKSPDDVEEGFIDLGNNIKGVSRHHATIDWVPEKKRYVIKCFGKNGMVVGGKWRGCEGVELLSSRTAIKLGPCCMYFFLPEESGANSQREEREQPFSAAALEAAQLHQQAIQADFARRQKLLTHAAIKQLPQSETGAAAAENAQWQSSRGRGVPAHAVTGKSYVELTRDAFESEELKKVAEEYGGLTSAEITNWAVGQYPEVFTSAEPRKALSTGVQGVLARRGEKGPIAAGKKGARWTLRESGLVKKRKIEQSEGAAMQHAEKHPEHSTWMNEHYSSERMESSGNSAGEYIHDLARGSRIAYDIDSNMAYTKANSDHHRSI